MRTVRFSTVRAYEVAPDQSGRARSNARPMLRVRIIGSRIGPDILALVDSGADRSLFPLDAAREAGVDLDRCRTAKMRGVGGGLTVSVCSVELVVEGRRFAIEACFAHGRSRRTTALLGRSDVFTEFVFGFDQRAGELLVEPHL